MPDAKSGSLSGKVCARRDGAHSFAPVSCARHATSLRFSKRLRSVRLSDNKNCKNEEHSVSLIGLILVGLLCFGSHTALGEIYKWVDKNGQAHYSGTAPAGSPYSVLRPAPQPTSEEQTRAQARLQDQMRQAESMRETRMKAAEEAAKAARERIDRETRCENAKLQLRFLEETQGMRWIVPGQEDSGIVHWQTDEEKNKMVQDWREEVRKVCESTGPVADQPPARPGVVAPPIRRRPR